MIEEKINVEVFSLDLEVPLASDKSEANTELEQKLSDMLKKPAFQFTLCRIFR